jgi:hypothetical protein
MMRLQEPGGGYFASDDLDEVAELFCSHDFRHDPCPATS